MTKEYEDVTMFWNQSVHTNREVMANRVDRIIKNKTEKNMYTSRCGNTADRVVTQKEAEKALKYKSLCTDIQQMWNMTCVIILVILGAIEILTQG
jgi:6-phosphogluconate dehydrogenase